MSKRHKYTGPEVVESPLTVGVASKYTDNIVWLLRADLPELIERLQKYAPKPQPKRVSARIGELEELLEYLPASTPHSMASAERLAKLHKPQRRKARK
jgi:hypothetical protein